jgi:acyl-CoA hydrolase
MDESGRPPAASRVTLNRLMTVLDTNVLGNVHGGVIMRLVDDAGGASAVRHSSGAAVTVAMDEMVFVTPVTIGDLLSASAQVNWTGRSSMEVGVRVTAERLDRPEPPWHVASAHLVFVAVDADGRPREVQRIVPEDDEGRRRLREAEIRRRHRLARREAILASRKVGDV